MFEHDEIPENQFHILREVKKESVVLPPPREVKPLTNVERLQRWIHNINQ